MLDNLNIDLAIDRISKYYPTHCLPSELKKRNGKAKKCGFKEIFQHLYNVEARMVAFHTSHSRLIMWVKALGILYYDNLGKNRKFNVVWKDVPNRWTDRNNSANSVVIEVHTADETAENSFMYKIKFFITRGTIQAQGNCVDIIAKEDFTVLKCSYHNRRADKSNLFYS